MYEPDLQRSAVLALGHSDVFFPYINTPPWAFLVAPLTFIPYPVAYWICVAVMVACLVAAAILALAGPVPDWAAALIIGAVLLAAAGTAALIGKRDVADASPPVPVEAVEGLKKDVHTLKSGSQ
jgi:hypothetical protein